jgi:hypothetical protein
MKLSETVRNYLQLFQTAGGETVIQGEPGERKKSVNSLQNVKHETIRNCLKLPAIDVSGIAVPLLRKAVAVKGRRGNASDDVPAVAVIW